MIFAQQAPLPARLANGTWVEVMRIARRDDKSEEGDRCLVGQVWFWHVPDFFNCF